nr:hypothetical protein CFP56_30662 [Quercus suber]
MGGVLEDAEREEGQGDRGVGISRANLAAEHHDLMMGFLRGQEVIRGRKDREEVQPNYLVEDTVPIPKLPMIRCSEALWIRSSCCRHATRLQRCASIGSMAAWRLLFPPRRRTESGNEIREGGKGR